MKPILSLLFAACILLGSCSKSDNKTTTPASTTPVDVDSMRYSVNGLTDVSIKRTDSVVLALGIVHNGGRQEKLDLAILGLPENVFATFQTTSGIPSYATTLTLKSSKALSGDYPIKIAARTASNTVKEFEIKLNIKKANESCAENMAGTYTYYDCASKSNADCKVKAMGPNKIELNGLPGIYNTVEADVDCIDETLNIPTTTVPAPPETKVSGTGKIINQDEFEIKYKASGPYLSTIECVLRFKRK